MSLGIAMIVLLTLPTILEYSPFLLPQSTQSIHPMALAPFSLIGANETNVVHVAAVAASEGDFFNRDSDLGSIILPKLSTVGIRGKWEGPVGIDEMFSQLASTGVEVVVLYTDLYSNRSGYASRENPRLWANLKYYVDKAHAHNLKILGYFSATQAYGYSDPSWRQKSGSSYSSDFLCPNSPYGSFAVDQAGRIIRAGADGIFLDTLYLHSESCTEGVPIGRLQEYRYQLIHEYARGFYARIKEANLDAVLIINNDNILDPRDRELYALSIERLQDVADGFLLEFVGLDSVTADGVERWMRIERYSNQNPKPLWVLAYTSSRDEYQRLLSVVQKYPPSGLWVQTVWYTKPVTNTQLLVQLTIVGAVVAALVVLVFVGGRVGVKARNFPKLREKAT